MQWFKRQGCLVKLIVLGSAALVLFCFCAFLIVIIPQTDTAWKGEYATKQAQREGMSRSFPVPAGQAAIADNAIEITILGVQRDAWSTIYQANMFNPEPDGGMEYILVAILVCNLKDASQTARLSRSDFRVVGERGVIYEGEIVIGLSKDLEPVELFGGSTIERQIPFQVGKGEKDLVLIYDSGLDTEARYLSLEN